MEKCIVSANIWGLANRMKCLVSSMRIAERYSRRLILYWPKNDHLNCDFSDLFENEIEQISEPEFKELSLSTEVLKDFSKVEVDDSDLRSDIIINTSWRFLLFPQEKYPQKLILPNKFDDGKGLDFKYDLVPAATKDNILAYLNRFIPRRSILDEVGKFAKNFDDNTISLQVRTWHATRQRDFPRNLFFDIKGLFKVMDNQKKSNFFVVCDSRKVIDRLLERYKGRILFHPEDNFETNHCSASGIQLSLVILLLLSKNKKLILSSVSTYSELSWWFGGCEAEVKIIPIPFLRWVAVVSLDRSIDYARNIKRFFTKTRP
ncbi:MAG: hypothetical protein JW734_10150 [Candidatus Omnitrophica bacterium]|nr:hypothetical protein [Candidatus Omnitrophota bacterium]